MTEELIRDKFYEVLFPSPSRFEKSSEDYASVSTIQTSIDIGQLESLALKLSLSKSLFIVVLVISLLYLTKHYLIKRLGWFLK